MIMSCLFLIGIVSCLFKGQSLSQLHYSDSYLDRHWHLDEIFVLTGIVLYIISLSSSSFVEEEQYTWHFLNSTLYLIFLIKTVHSVLKESNSTLVHRATGKSFDRNEFSYTSRYELTPGKGNGFKICTVLIILVAGRVIRGWHQGGVNWVHFPDISKLLAQSDSSIVKCLQIISVLSVMAMYSVSLMLLRAKSKYAIGIWLSHISCGFLVLVHIWENQINTSQPTDHSTNSIAQMFYAVVIVSITGTALASPWIFPIYSREAELASSSGHNSQKAMYSHYISDSMFLTGITYAVFWCLVQLLLQQANNAIPLLLIFLQTISSIAHFSLDKTLHEQWVQVSF